MKPTHEEDIRQINGNTEFYQEFCFPRVADSKAFVVVTNYGTPWSTMSESMKANQWARAKRKYKDYCRKASHTKHIIQSK